MTMVLVKVVLEYKWSWRETETAWKANLGETFVYIEIQPIEYKTGASKAIITNYLSETHTLFTVL